MVASPTGDATDLLKAVEDLAVEQFITQTGIGPKASEAQPLDIAILSQRLPGSM